MVLARGISRPRVELPRLPPNQLALRQNAAPMSLPAIAALGRALTTALRFMAASSQMRGHNRLVAQALSLPPVAARAPAEGRGKRNGGKRGRGGGQSPSRGNRNSPPRSGIGTIGLRPQAPGRTIGGSATFRVQLGQIHGTITSSTTGKVSMNINLSTNTFSKCAAFATLYDQVRLRSFSFTWKPMLGYTATGQVVAYFDYKGTDGNVATLAAASMMQDAVTRRVTDELRISWKKQSNVDDEFVSSAAGTFFNSKMPHKLVIVVEGAAVSEVLAQAVVTGVLEFTGLHD